MTSSFTSKVVHSSANAGLVYLVTAQADGKPAWYYLQVDEPKHKEFKKQLETGTLDLANFGKILHSGWGTTPPDFIDALVKEQFENAS